MKDVEEMDVEEGRFTKTRKGLKNRVPQMVPGRGACHLRHPPRRHQIVGVLGTERTRTGEQTSGQGSGKIRPFKKPRKEKVNKVQRKDLATVPHAVEELVARRHLQYRPLLGVANASAPSAREEWNGDGPARPAAGSLVGTSGSSLSAVLQPKMRTSNPICPQMPVPPRNPRAPVT